MNGEQHRREAERLLRRDYPMEMQRAIAHAILALVDTITEAPNDDDGKAES